ncbi:6PF2K-domain-containing protein [Cystobasidium minutum MCA 4210]|uniref:6PF2K-domain-containing protein n=1 Tax=Cystobasidium minutum MCA 4210 TaxID=1397322 RepID=UPI0034CE521A|eukprot:jgi/Rhomi1/163572/estExt_Genewise1Plus.C_80174
MAAPLYSTESGRLYHAGQILISCVGLPARGKTHISRSMLRYLRWLGVKAEVFSLGDYRRKRLGNPANLPKDYFSPDSRSAESEKLRQQMKNEMMDIVMKYFHEGGQVAIYDANNTTIAERQFLRDICAREHVNIMFIETICSDAIVEKNIRAVKLASPDYKGWNPEDALKDYWSRIRNQEKFYQPIENPSFPYVKVIDIGERIIVNNIQGYLQSRIVFFLMNIHNRYRKIYMARSGASYAEHSYKADAGLSEVGEAYSYALRDFLLNKRQQDRLDPVERARQRRLVVWTSARRRCAGTAKPFLEFGYKVIERGQMAEINPGIVDGLSRKEIKQLYPDEYERSIKEPYAHRFPRAESYHDLSVRLEPTIFELERDRSDLLIIGHGSVLRCLFAYLKGLAPADIPKVMIQRGDLVEIAPTSYGVVSKTYTFWRPPAGHEDVQTEPGTMPGTYGSPANPPAGFGNLLNPPPGFAARYSLDIANEGRTPTAGRDWLALTEATPRMQNLTLEELQTASLKSPQWGNAPHLPDEALKEDSDEQYEDPDGESGNTCEWEKAKSPVLANVKEQAPGRYA